MVCAAMEGWAYPFPREAIILADLYDLQHARTGAKNRRPYPRPYPEGKVRVRMKPRASVSQEQIRAALASQGHQAP